MLKLNEHGKIESAQMEVIPTNDCERNCLNQFANLTAQQRAELIVCGYELLANIYQRNADEVTG